MTIPLIPGCTGDPLVYLNYRGGSKVDARAVNYFSLLALFSLFVLSNFSISAVMSSGFVVGA